MNSDQRSPTGKITANVRTVGQILYVEMTGQWSLEEFLRVLREAKAAGDQSGPKLIALDHTAVDGGITIMDRVAAGQEIARILSPEDSLAVVAPREKITKVGQIIANNRGTRMFVTDTPEKALEWLNSSRAARPRITGSPE